LFLLPIWWVL